jgi:cytochrome b
MEITQTRAQTIWDLPTRVFHWGFAASVLGALGFAKLAPEESPYFYLHIVFGVTAGLLLIWRVLWGFIGSKHVKFSSFAFSPKEYLAYFKAVLSGRGEYHAGHNPGGALAAWALLAFTGLAVVSGISMGFFGEALEEVHEVSTNLLMIAVAVHIVGVGLATVMNKENYVAAMFHGKKRATPEEAITSSRPISAVALVILVAAGAGYFAKGFDLLTGTFTAPGTGFSVRFGEEEHEHEHHGEGGDHEERGEHDDESRESSASD